MTLAKKNYNFIINLSFHKYLYFYELKCQKNFIKKKE
jgi:hypothetical protein